MLQSIILGDIATNIPENVSRMEYIGTTHRAERFVEINAVVTAFIIMMSSFTLVGIPSNLLLVVVFRQRQKRHNGTNNLFALSLAVTDMTICSLTIPMRTCSLLGMIRNDVGCSVTLFLTYTTVSFQVILMMGVCIERYCAVCRPFQHWRIKHVVAYVSTAAVYCASVSAVAFPTVVFDDTFIYFCKRRENHMTDIVNGVNGLSWFFVVIVMTMLYTSTIVKICKRTRSKKKVQDASQIRDVSECRQGSTIVIQ